MAREYIIYCDESDDKGEFYSNFYGGALLLANDREAIENVLTEAKGPLARDSEFKWTYIGPHNEQLYIAFMEAFFGLIADSYLKVRIMFTQNINQTKGLVEYSVDSEFFILYYHFLKLAFGLRYCNLDRAEDVNVTVYLDDVPDSDEKFENFKDYLSSLSAFPVFHRNRIVIRKESISDVNSEDHVILQAIDVVLGAMQFRLNEKHKAVPEGKKRRCKRTRAKSACISISISYFGDCDPASMSADQPVTIPARRIGGCIHIGIGVSSRPTACAIWQEAKRKNSGPRECLHKYP